MFGIFKAKPPPEVILNEGLIDSVYTLLATEELELIITDPVFKMSVMNLYTVNFQTLLSTIASNKVYSNIVLISVERYFQGTDITTIRETFRKLIKHLEKSKIKPYAEHDLMEITSTLIQLSEEYTGE